MAYRPVGAEEYGYDPCILVAAVASMVKHRMERNDLQMSEQAGDAEYFRTVHDTLEFGRNSNSYKFAVLRALAHWGKSGGKKGRNPKGTVT
jgi:hypothetical protein